jgi:hypothetical protein
MRVLMIFLQSHSRGAIGPLINYASGLEVRHALGPILKNQRTRKGMEVRNDADEKSATGIRTTEVVRPLYRPTLGGLPLTHDLPLTDSSSPSWHSLRAMLTIFRVRWELRVTV